MGFSGLRGSYSRASIFRCGHEGGDRELLKFIGENNRYPEKARENNIAGRVIISFILMADGSIQGIDFLQSRRRSITSS